MSNSLWPQGLQHTSLPCPSPTPRIYSNSCPSRWWCHPTISSSVIPFPSSLQSLPASESFQMSQFFASGDQSIGVSTSTSVLPINTQDWSPLGWTGLPGASEAFHSWQRSWGRRLGIHKGGIELQESARIFSSISPQKTRVCLLYCFMLSPLTLLGTVPYHHLALSVKELTYSSN